MWCTNRLLWHTNSDFYGIRTPPFMPYEPFLLGVGVVFNLLKLKHKIMFFAACGRLLFIHLQCWEVLPFLTIQGQRRIKFRVLGVQDCYTPLALTCRKGQHLPALEVYKTCSASPKPHPSKPHPCNMAQAKMEVALQFSESCAAEVALQHSLFFSAVWKSFLPKAALQRAKNCTATLKKLRCRKVALSCRFLRISIRSPPRKPNQRKGQNEKFMNFAHFCEFWCFSLGKQARFTSNFCSGMPL